MSSDNRVYQSNNKQQQPKYTYWKQLPIETETFDNEVNLPLNKAICAPSTTGPSSFETKHNIHLNSKPKQAHHYKIEMTFSFNSSLWKKGNIAYIKLNNDLYWLDHHKWEDEVNSSDSIWSNQISMIVNSKFIRDNYIPLTFGVKLTENKVQCDNDAITFKNVNILYK